MFKQERKETRGEWTRKEQVARARGVADMRSLISVMQLQTSSGVLGESNKLKMVMVQFWLSKSWGGGRSIIEIHVE